MILQIQQLKWQWFSFCLDCEINLFNCKTNFQILENAFRIKKETEVKNSIFDFI